MTEIKKKVGRPQKSLEDVFPPNWKELIIEWSLQGWSEAEMRCEVCKIKGVFHTQLWYALQEREEEFSKALQMAKVLRQAWWERRARTSLNENTFQTGLWYACMKNMFGYRDKQEDRPDESLKNQELEFQAIPKGQLDDRFSRFLN